MNNKIYSIISSLKNIIYKNKKQVKNKETKWIENPLYSPTLSSSTLSSSSVSIWEKNPLYSTLPTPSVSLVNSPSYSPRKNEPGENNPEPSPKEIYFNKIANKIASIKEENQLKAYNAYKSALDAEEHIQDFESKAKIMANLISKSIYPMAKPEYQSKLNSDELQARIYSSVLDFFYRGYNDDGAFLRGWGRALWNACDLIFKDLIFKNEDNPINCDESKLEAYLTGSKSIDSCSTHKPKPRRSIAPQLNAVPPSPSQSTDSKSIDSCSISKRRGTLFSEDKEIIYTDIKLLDTVPPSPTK